MRKRIFAVCSITFLLALCLQCQNIGGVKATIKTTKIGESNIEYVQISGLADATIQKNINEELETFATWPSVNIEDDVNFDAKAKYAILGKKYLAVRSAQSFRSPIQGEQIDSQIFDLETGDFGISADSFIVSVDAISKAFEAGKFVQLQPSEDLDSMGEIMPFLLSLGAFDFYLTENSLGIYIPTPTGVDIEVTSDYVFEAPYSEITDALAPSLKRLLKI
ncbi:MAG: hypothetical protein LBD28_02200 [Tannerellaceae bacterium]|jgi:hypothetical protein|nr:hypothetical protein [Tannerellaceae bacterium]